MKLPEIINKLLQAQADFDSVAYANCFAETAVILDEGEDYRGKEAIGKWNKSTNAKYRTELEVVDFEQRCDKAVLTAKVSGTFDGSPVLLDHQFELANELIASLEITFHE